MACFPTYCTNCHFCAQFANRRRLATNGHVHVRDIVAACFLCQHRELRMVSYTQVMQALYIHFHFLPVTLVGSMLPIGNVLCLIICLGLCACLLVCTANMKGAGLQHWWISMPAALYCLLVGGRNYWQGAIVKCKRPQMAGSETEA